MYVNRRAPRPGPWQGAPGRLRLVPGASASEFDKISAQARTGDRGMDHGKRIGTTTIGRLKRIRYEEDASNIGNEMDTNVLSKRAIKNSVARTYSDKSQNQQEITTHETPRLSRGKTVSSLQCRA